MNPLLRGSMVRWTKDSSFRPGWAYMRKNQGVRLGDVGLVVSQNVRELEVLIKGDIHWFHSGEVSVVA